jgi:hypothetical protein
MVALLEVVWEIAGAGDEPHRRTVDGFRSRQHRGFSAKEWLPQIGDAAIAARRLASPASSSRCSLASPYPAGLLRTPRLAPRRPTPARSQRALRAGWGGARRQSRFRGVVRRRPQTRAGPPICGCARRIAPGRRPLSQHRSARAGGVLELCARRLCGSGRGRCGIPPHPWSGSRTSAGGTCSASSSRMLLPRTQRVHGGRAAGSSRRPSRPAPTHADASTVPASHGRDTCHDHHGSLTSHCSV